KLRENTIIVLWGDHGWHLGEHAIWGKHALFEESLRSPLIISHSGLVNPGKATRAMVETLDIFPTICELTGLKAPAGLNGQSLVPILKNPIAKGHPAFAYKRGVQTIRTDTRRLIAHKSGQLELYDHTSSAGESKNLAEAQPEKAAALLKQLRARLPQ
ncbi:MAG: sulfatase-like hydrolase/transferase, partial [Verrucomicrobia bacterium]|nr:sulfatase-like hydrolase/transferase [Verrucomicrobiota bacterium]